VPSEVRGCPARELRQPHLHQHAARRRLIVIVGGTGTAWLRTAPPQKRRGGHPRQLAQAAPALRRFVG
jgi:hypothetical protein